jgi:1,4-dihydroxy-2-naphthoyl-CoA hydrolase
MIWNKKYTVDELQGFCQNTMVTNLGIEFLEIGDDFLKAQMPVDTRTIQPIGILHGGASVALAETIGSVAAHMTIDPDKNLSVGLEINANHIKSIRKGYVIGTGRPLHLGRKTQVWHIEIKDKDNSLISISRLTIAIIENRS